MTLYCVKELQDDLNYLAQKYRFNSSLTTTEVTNNSYFIYSTARGSYNLLPTVPVLPVATATETTASDVVVRLE